MAQRPGHLKAPAPHACVAYCSAASCSSVMFMRACTLGCSAGTPLASSVNVPAKALRVQAARGCGNAGRGTNRQRRDLGEMR